MEIKKLKGDLVALSIRQEQDLLRLNSKERLPSTSRFFEHKRNQTTKNSFSSYYGAINCTPDNESFLKTLETENQYTRLVTEPQSSFKNLYMKKTISNYHNASLETVIQKVENSPLARTRRLNQSREIKVIQGNTSPAYEAPRQPSKTRRNPSSRYRPSILSSSSHIYHK